MKTVAIIGGGFSGTMAAVNLARLSEFSLRILLINYRHPLGRGVAYGTRREEHVLNVAARNMSAVPDHPNHFLDWLRTRVEYCQLPSPQLREMFVPRRVYGDYLRSLLLGYMRPIDDHHPAGIRVIEDEAVDVAVNDSDEFGESVEFDPLRGPVRVVLRSGDSHEADRVLLATGNQPPGAIPSANGPLSHPAFCSDPWQEWQKQIPAPTKDIIVLGTGLTMVDVFLTLNELGWQGNLIAVSRNGMVPQAHFRGIEYPDFLPDEPESLGLDELVTLLGEHCERLRQLGENPGIIVDRLRPFTQRIWQGFSVSEKRKFLERYAARWNVIRHRIAQPIHQRLTEAITDGRVRIVKGRVRSLSERGEDVLVTVEKPNGREQSLCGGLVINCTGPQDRLADTEVPLFQNLLRRGLIRPDELDMGIDVGPDFSVIDRDGRKSEFLYAIGPLMKGTLWETTAVPELRGQAMRVAQSILEEAEPVEAGRDYRLSVEEEHVIEYYI